MTCVVDLTAGPGEPAEMSITTADTATLIRGLQGRGVAWPCKPHGRSVTAMSTQTTAEQTQSLTADHDPQRPYRDSELVHLLRDVGGPVRPGGRHSTRTSSGNWYTGW